MTLMKFRLDFLFTDLSQYLNILEYIWWSFHSMFFLWAWVRGDLNLRCGCMTFDLTKQMTLSQSHMCPQINSHTTTFQCKSRNFQNLTL